ncbi:MAG TPA: glycoside hydrolase family 3 N-terminal domain-containing protein [Thermohalobaculum sp.]|nr:glycoside hydrolase family 3 N-terminal domain-containing protein [Thermohalobaculum sp.]
MSQLAAIFGFKGPRLEARERDFFRDARPWGFILFDRNVEDPDQLRRLTAELRDAAGRDAPILIDQEGGRVQRLRPPHWPQWQPVLRLFDADDQAGAEEALTLRTRIIAAHLHGVGIDVNTMPLLDVPAAGADEIIGDRALGWTPEEIGRRGRLVCETLKAGGVLPVVKHIPGHGRAPQDSHKVLPQVTTPLVALDRVDFAAFRAVADQEIGMTAHVLYAALDPDRAATESPVVIDLIRKLIGFDGLLMGDDISMEALTGSFEKRVRDGIHAGCDLVLHCNGDRSEMMAVADSCPRLSGKALERARRAEKARRAPDDFDMAEAVRRYEKLTGHALGDVQDVGPDPTRAGVAASAAGA